MSRSCYICGKGTVSGNQISHSVKHTKRVWKPNLQKVRVMVDGSPKRVLVCTRCLRSKVDRAI